MAKGYTGVIVRVDLTKGKIGEEHLDEQLLREYIGGSGLGARILYNETTAATDPLGPDNPLIFMTGPLTGTKVPTSGRHAVIARSPQTGIWGESDSGGSWGTALKGAGYDGVIVTGQSPTPVYLWIHDRRVDIRGANELWGLDTYEVDDRLKEATDLKASVACIGPAGERLARIAAVMNDGRHGRAAGRTGLGAVMGSKKLKAIVCSGSQPVGIAHPEALNESLKRLAPLIREKNAGVAKFGTAGGVVGNAGLGDMPAKNWTLGDWVSQSEKISGQAMAETMLTGRYYCKSCVIGCGRVIQVADGRFESEVRGGGPEYEALAGLGSLCLVDDLPAVALANELCNRYGLDVISTGNCIAFAMEAYERGLITRSDADGLELTWGDPRVLIRLVHAIGKREGLGKLLGEGVRAAARTLGGIAPELAVEVKGLELPFHDPRALSSLAVAYATYPRGACHRGMSHAMERFPIAEIGLVKALDRFEISGKGRMTAITQDYYGLYNSLKLCQFIGGAIAPSEIVNWTNQVTGWDMSLDELLRAGERAINLKRMYNLRLGLTRQDDVLPPRIGTEKLKEGGAKDFIPNLDVMLDEYYAHRGWSKEGIPLPETLIRLGLKAQVQDLPDNLRSPRP